jgi:hypothetical protein
LRDQVTLHVAHALPDTIALVPPAAASPAWAGSSSNDRDRNFDDGQHCVLVTRNTTFPALSKYLHCPIRR